MLKNKDLELLEELFLSNYFSYVNVKNIKLNNSDNTLKKLHSDTIDILYDAMDTVLEILDISGANK